MVELLAFKPHNRSRYKVQGPLRGRCHLSKILKDELELVKIKEGDCMAGEFPGGVATAPV